jgi:hypothetical protein
MHAISIKRLVYARHAGYPPEHYAQQNNQCGAHYNARQMVYAKVIMRPPCYDGRPSRTTHATNSKRLVGANKECYMLVTLHGHYAQQNKHRGAQYNVRQSVRHVGYPHEPYAQQNNQCSEN